jgi:predicted MFS family arabinose efflux permease
VTAKRDQTSILVVLAFTNLLSYAARNALFTVYPKLQSEFGLDTADIGLLTTAFMVPHALATLPFGWAGDRYDRRDVLTAGIVIASIAGVVTAFAQTFFQLAAARAVVGLATASVVPIGNSIIAQVFEGPIKASRIAVFNLGLFVGAVAGFALGLAVGFPLVTLVIAIPGLVLAVAIRTLRIPAHPGDALLGPEMSMRTRARQFGRDARRLLGIPTLRWMMASTTAMAFAAGGYNAWLKQFLTDDKGMSDAQATMLLSAAIVGGLAGILTGARVADRLRRKGPAGRLWTIVAGMSMTLPFAALAIVLPAGPGLYVAGIGTMFFISWYHAPIAASVDDLAPPELVVAAQGLVIFTMHLLGTSPSSWVIGVVAKHSSLFVAMWVPTALLAVAAVCMVPAARGFARDAALAKPSRPGGESTPASL